LFHQQGDVAYTQEAQVFFFPLGEGGARLDFFFFSFPNVFPNMFPIGGRGWGRGGLGRHPHLINAKIKKYPQSLYMEVGPPKVTLIRTIYGFGSPIVLELKTL
jgi:hypothetical protein